MQRLITDRGERTDIHIHNAGGWVNAFRVRVAYAEQFRIGPVFLAGEAAHVQTGGGLCSAIYDSSNLSWKLATALCGGPSWLLDTYEEERGCSARHEIETTWELMYRATGLDSDGGGRAEPNPHQMLTALNDPQMHRQMSGLAIRYRESPLSLTWGDATGKDVVAGDRAPDAPCRDLLADTMVRLFDLYRGPHWTLLGFGPQGAETIRAYHAPGFINMKPHAVLKPTDPAAENAVIDVEGHAHRSFQIDDSAIVLIRLDNYIGLIAWPADAAALDAYFDHLRDPHF
ncbi:hypothetical protein ABIA39_007009 [Nocardia sp. GAS34]